MKKILFTLLILSLTSCENKEVEVFTELEDERSRQKEVEILNGKPKGIFATSKTK